MAPAGLLSAGGGGETGGGDAGARALSLALLATIQAAVDAADAEAAEPLPAAVSAHGSLKRFVVAGLTLPRVLLHFCLQGVMHCDMLQALLPQ